MPYRILHLSPNVRVRSDDVSATKNNDTWTDGDLKGRETCKHQVVPATLPAPREFRKRSITHCLSVSHRASSSRRLFTRNSCTGCVLPMICRVCSERRFNEASTLSDVAHSVNVPARVSQNFTASRASKPAWAKILQGKHDH